MSDRIAVMNGGVIEQVGEPESVYERPATAFVAGFIGVSNLMPATVVSPGELRLDAGVTVRAATDVSPAGERCHAVVRPEKLEVAGPGANGSRPSVEGTVESSLYLGTATQLVVRLGDGTAMTVLVPNADEAERRRLPAGGAAVRLAWDTEHMHVVKAAQGGGTQ